MMRRVNSRVRVETRRFVQARLSRRINAAKLLIHSAFQVSSTDLVARGFEIL
jgi:hypothetical protein